LNKGTEHKSVGMIKQKPQGFTESQVNNIREFGTKAIFKPDELRVETS
jgi:hypothetical protein